MSAAYAQIDHLLAVMPTAWVRRNPQIRDALWALVHAARRDGAAEAREAENARAVAWLIGSCLYRPADAEPCGRCDPCYARRGIESGGLGSASPPPRRAGGAGPAGEPGAVLRRPRPRRLRGGGAETMGGQVSYADVYDDYNPHQGGK